MRVLFVCVHNSGRSQMAEAYANHLTRISGADVVAESAGTVPGGQVSSAAVQVMREDGVSMEGHVSKLLTRAMVDQADKVISMGCGVDAAACPAGTILTEDWDLDDPAGKGIEEVRAIRDQIKRRVAALLSGAAKL